MLMVTAQTSRRDLLDLALSGEPLGALASERPCALYAHSGGSRPSLTQGHHIYPIYLQNRKYGKIQNGELMFLCGTCHDNVHTWLYWIMGERKLYTPESPPRAKALAKRAQDWFNEPVAA